MAPRKPQDATIVKAAKDAISAVLSDRSVSPALTKERLEVLRDEIDIALEALAEDKRKRTP